MILVTLVALTVLKDLPGPSGCTYGFTGPLLE